MAELEPILTLTDTARERILEVRAAEQDSDALGLWLEVTGIQGDAYTYDMYFRRVDEASGDHVVQHDDRLAVVIPAADVDKVRGSQLDLSGGGMVLRNPNTPEPPSTPRSADLPELDRDDPVVAKIVEILEMEINPQIAAHGGYAELVAVEAPVAYLRMGGGCQGCGMAAVTLTQGIEVALVEAIPEIERVLDVTDHAAGENPYYQAAKK